MTNDEEISFELTDEDLANAEELSLDNMEGFLEMLIRWSYDQHGRDGIVSVYMSFEKALFTVLQEAKEVDLDLIQH